MDANNTTATAPATTTAAAEAAAEVTAWGGYVNLGQGTRFLQTARLHAGGLRYIVAERRDGISLFTVALESREDAIQALTAALRNGADSVEVYVRLESGNYGHQNDKARRMVAAATARAEEATAEIAARRQEREARRAQEAEAVTLPAIPDDVEGLGVNVWDDAEDGLIVALFDQARVRPGDDHLGDLIGHATLSSEATAADVEAALRAAGWRPVRPLRHALPSAKGTATLYGHMTPRDYLARDLSEAMDAAKGARAKAAAAWGTLAAWEDTRGDQGTHAEREAMGDLEDALQRAADDVEPDSDHEFARAEAVAEAAAKWARSNR